MRGNEMKRERERGVEVEKEREGGRRERMMMR